MKYYIEDIEIKLHLCEFRDGAVSKWELEFLSWKIHENRKSTWP